MFRSHSYTISCVFVCACVRRTHGHVNRISQEGGVGVLLTAMRSHRMKPLVQQHAASALQNLAGNHTDNKLRIAGEGGIPLIISAMSNHPHEAQVCAANLSCYTCPTLYLIRLALE